MTTAEVEAFFNAPCPEPMVLKVSEIEVTITRLPPAPFWQANVSVTHEGTRIVAYVTPNTSGHLLPGRDWQDRDGLNTALLTLIDQEKLLQKLMRYCIMNPTAK